MSNFTKWVIGLIICMFAITIVVVVVIQNRFFNPQPLTTTEAVSIVENLYGGTADSFERIDDFVHIDLTKNNTMYTLKVDAITGEVQITDSKKIKSDDSNNTNIKTKEEIRTLVQSKGTIQSIALQQENEPQYVVKVTNNEMMKTIVVNAKSGEILSETEVAQTPSTPTSIITKEKAKQIALSQLNGEVEYVVYEETSNGGYYLIEIDGSDQEAIFQIHAITGKVISITREHDDIDNDNDDYEDDDDGDDEDDDDDDED